MGFAKELFDALRTLGALEKRTQDVASRMETVNSKLETILERVTRLEARQDYLEKNVQASIMANIKAEIVQTQTLLKLSPQTGRRLGNEGDA